MKIKTFSLLLCDKYYSIFKDLLNKMEKERQSLSKLNRTDMERKSKNFF